jgi:hypothetical protein
MIDPALLEELRRFVNASRLPEWQRDLIETVPDHLVKQIAEDFRKGPPPAGPTLPPVRVMGAPTVKTGDVGPQHRPIDTDATTDRSGWQEAPKVDAWKPPGVEIMDEMMDQQDRIDRAARIRELGMAQHSRRLAEAAREAEDKDKAHRDGKLKP